jgi:phage terminase large subunit-like protein
MPPLDLRRSEPAGAKFSKAAADRPVRWIETNLRHYQGRWAGQPFYLLSWQKRLIRELFGWQRADGARLYRRCYVEAPRKSGKTMLAPAAPRGGRAASPDRSMSLAACWLPDGVR